jgi:MFS transporter, ACS family, glucarate transporter
VAYNLPMSLSPPHLQPPTRARYWVVVFAVTLAIIQYVDRVCISKAMPFIQRDLHFTNVQAGYVFGAFTLAYALFEIPAGWLGDKLGPRKMLLRVVVWWSVFTAATARAGSVAGMVAVRFLFGAGEAGCFPNITKAFTTWLPPGERVRAQGVLWLAARWGGAATPLLVVMVLHWLGSWRRAFEVFGALGLVWAFFFYRWFRDNPHEHPSVNDAEKQLLTGVDNLASRHAHVPWAVFFGSPSAWLLWLQYACLSYVWYFYVTWFPTYLDTTHGRHLGPIALAVLAGLPLFGGGFGSLIAGFCANALARRIGGIGRARRALGATGFIVAAVCLVASDSARNSPLALALLVGLAGLFNDFALPCAWGACMDVGGRFSGTFSGAMNMMGNLGGFLAPIATGYILDITGRWDLVFYVSSAVYLLGAVSWILLDPVTPLDREGALAPGTATGA